VTVPASALAGYRHPVVATPTFDITAFISFQVQNVLSNGDLDANCGDNPDKITFGSAQTIALIESTTASCGPAKKDDKIKIIDLSTTDETEVLTTWYKTGSGYGADTVVTLLSGGNDINFKSKTAGVGGTFTIYLYQANPVTGALIGPALDWITKPVTGDTGHQWFDLGGLAGTVLSGKF